MNEITVMERVMQWTNQVPRVLRWVLEKALDYRPIGSCFLPGTQQEIWFALVLIDRKHADRMLASRPDGRTRRVNQRRVEFYHKVMERSGWKITPQGCSVDADGCLLDAQHRLLAVPEDFPQWFFVSLGWATDVGMDIDTHRPRSEADLLGIVHGEQEDPKVPSTYRALLHGIAPWCNAYRPDSDQLRVLNGLFGEVVRGLLRVARRPFVNAPVLAAATRAALAGHDAERIKYFLAMGNEINAPDEDTAALCLSRWLLSPMGKTMLKAHGASRARVYRIAQTAMSHFLDGRRVTNPRETQRDLFPLPDEIKAELDQAEIAYH